MKAPGSGVAYFVDDNQTAWQTHFTILARIVDEKGETVRKGSQPYRLTGPAKDVHVARQGDILFYRQPTVDPGRYTIDYALYDELSGQAGTGTLPLAVEKREASALAMSDVVLVDHAEAVPAEQRDPRNPLYLGTTLIYPNLGTPVTRSKRGSLVFFYTARAGKRPLTGRVELVQDGRVLATRPLQVPPPDDTGLVQHANELPLDEVGAGPYELRVTVSDGKDTVDANGSVHARAVDAAGDARPQAARHWCRCGSMVRERPKAGRFSSTGAARPASADSGGRARGPGRSAAGPAPPGPGHGPAHVDAGDRGCIAEADEDAQRRRSEAAARADQRDARGVVRTASAGVP